MLKISLTPHDATEYFRKVLDQALEERRKNPGVYISIYKDEVITKRSDKGQWKDQSLLPCNKIRNKFFVFEHNSVTGAPHARIFH